MARRSSRSVVAPDNTNELDSLLLDPAVMAPLHPMSPFSDLTEIEDNRQFHPEAANRPPLSFHHYTEFDVYEQARPYNAPVPKRATFKRPYAGATQNRSPISGQIAFRAPDRVAVCVRRKQRREVLHALRKAGRGSRRNRRYNSNSQIRC